MTPSSSRPGKAKAWIEAMRPRTLPVSIAGVVAGTACALQAHGFSWLPCLIALLFAILAQIVSNFANEYFDYRNGFDRKGREGYRRGVTEGDISPQAMKTATFSLLALDCLLGCSLIIWGGWWLIPVGIAIALFAIAYSAGPYPLSHHGLGDVAVILFFGIVPVMFTCYVQTGTMTGWPETLAIGAATGMLAANVLIVNNYRDMEDDASVGKHTTVVIFGRKAMAGVYLSFFTIGLATFAWLTPPDIRGTAIPLWLILLLLYMRLWRYILSSRGSGLNKALKFTAILMLASCLGFLGLSLA